MSDRNYAPQIETKVHVWDGELQVKRRRYNTDSRWLEIEVTPDVTVVFCFDNEESEAAFFDAVAAADPRRSE